MEVGFVLQGFCFAESYANWGDAFFQLICMQVFSLFSE